MPGRLLQPRHSSMSWQVVPPVIADPLNGGAPAWCKTGHPDALHWAGESQQKAPTRQEPSPLPVNKSLQTYQGLNGTN